MEDVSSSVIEGDEGDAETLEEAVAEVVQAEPTTPGLTTDDLEKAANLNKMREEVFKSFGTFFLILLDGPSSVGFRVLVSSGKEGESPEPASDTMLAVLESIIRRMKFQEEIGWQQQLQMQEMFAAQQARAQETEAKKKKPRLYVPAGTPGAS